MMKIIGYQRSTGFLGVLYCLCYVTYLLNLSDDDLQHTARHKQRQSAHVKGPLAHHGSCFESVDVLFHKRNAGSILKRSIGARGIHSFPSFAFSCLISCPSPTLFGAEHMPLVIHRAAHSYRKPMP